VDRILLSLAQRIQNFFQVYFDINCFNIERFFYLIIIELSVIFRILSFDDGQDLLIKNMFLGVLFPVFLAFYFLSFIIEKRVCKNTNTANHCEIEFKGLRLLSIFFNIVLGLIIALAIKDFAPRYEFVLLNIIFIFFSIALYFASSTPLPPAELKMKKWIKSFKTKKICSN